MNDLWIARDKDGDLWLYDVKPEIVSDGCYGYADNDYLYRSIRMFECLFPELTFEVGPAKVTIKLEE